MKTNNINTPSEWFISYEPSKFCKNAFVARVDGPIPDSYKVKVIEIAAYEQALAGLKFYVDSENGYHAKAILKKLGVPYES